MKIYNGIGVGKNSAKGKIINYSAHCGVPSEKKISDTASEKSRFRLAKFIAEKELSNLYKKALSELGETPAMIFDIHKMMLQDDTYTDMVSSIIDSRRINAERAVYDTASTLSKLFEELDDGYMRERRTDVWDISRRVIAILASDSRSYPKLSEPSVILSENLTPSELLLPKRRNILAVVLTQGSQNSHTAILAEKMGIPLLVKLDLKCDTIEDGTIAEIDCEKGTMTI